jgi:hypothetical protein
MRLKAGISPSSDCRFVELKIISPLLHPSTIVAAYLLRIPYNLCNYLFEFVSSLIAFLYILYAFRLSDG